MRVSVWDRDARAGGSAGCCATRCRADGRAHFEYAQREPVAGRRRCMRHVTSQRSALTSRSRCPAASRCSRPRRGGVSRRAVRRAEPRAADRRRRRGACARTARASPRLRGAADRAGPPGPRHAVARREPTRDAGRARPTARSTRRARRRAPMVARRRLPADRARRAARASRCSTPAGAGSPAASSQRGVAALRGLGAPARSRAAIGPGAGPCCYEVGDGGPRRVRAPERAQRRPQGASRRERLEAAGVGEVHDGGLCTICDERFFSHRRDGGVTGARRGSRGGADPTASTRASRAQPRAVREEIAGSRPRPGRASRSSPP